MKVKVCIINIGNELLLGQTVNTNLSWIGKQLAELGLPVSRSITIQDEPDAIKSTLAEEWKTNDIVFVTGGLGPTDDDLTKACIAEFFGKNLEFREEVWQSVQFLFNRRNLKTPDVNRSQAMVPQDFEALLNKVGTAPGLYYKENGKSLFALPGVPVEMKHLYTDYIKDILAESYTPEPVFIRVLHTWNITESALAEKLKGLKPPQDMQLAWLPQTGRVDLRIYGTNESSVTDFMGRIYKIAQDVVWGVDDEKPQDVLQRLMIERNLTLSVAESCTGGLVQELITGIPGSSKYFAGGIIAYSNGIKTDLLNVKQETLDQFGAVSIETAREMAFGIRQKTNSTISISTTGIAGPDGGTPEKPVGTVCFAISDEKQTISRILVFNGDRKSIRWKAAEYVILLLIEHVRRKV